MTLTDDDIAMLRVVARTQPLSIGEAMPTFRKFIASGHVGNVERGFGLTEKGRAALAAADGAPA